MKLCIYPGCGISYAISHVSYKQRMIKNKNISHTHIGSSGDQSQEVQEWQLSQKGKVKCREDVHQEGHLGMTSQKTYQ